MTYLSNYLILYFDTKTTLSFLVVIIALYIVLFNGKRRNLPPGPIRLPLIGNLLSIAIQLFLSGDKLEYLLAKYSRQYGKVFSIKIGPKLVIVANGPQSIKEAFQNPLITDRPTTKLLETISMDKGIVPSSGKLWKYQRKLTVSTFRHFGVGGSTFETNITEEAALLLQEMFRHTHHNKPLDPNLLVGTFMSNIVCSVIMGKRYDHNDSKFNHFLIIMEKLVDMIGSGGALFFVPALRYVYHEDYKKVISSFEELKYFMNDVITEHKQALEETHDKINDIIDVFLHEINNNSNNNNGVHGALRSETPIDEDCLISTSLFNFIAGIDTSTKTFLWILLYMITYPEVQAEVQKELDEVVGRNRLPKWSDRNNLPYTESVLHECQRIQPPLALGFPHCASKDTTLSGYDVPKGSIVISNTWAVHNDPDVWANPRSFQPERFLDKEGNLQHSENFLPFGSGHRSCPGESIAKMATFLCFTHILHRFTIKSPLNGRTYSFEGISGVVLSPQPFEIIAESRKI